MSCLSIIKYKIRLSNFSKSFTNPKQYTLPLSTKNKVLSSRLAKIYLYLLSDVYLTSAPAVDLNSVTSKAHINTSGEWPAKIRLYTTLSNLDANKVEQFIF